MSKKKTNKKVQLSYNAAQAKHKRDYLLRLKSVCDKLVGPGWFEVIPPFEIDIIYKKRYSPLTIKIAPGTVIESGRWNTYYKALSDLLNTPAFDVPEQHIPLKTMLSEGLTLIHFVSMMAKNCFPGSEELRSAFKPYLITDHSYYSYLSEQLSKLLFLVDLRSGNYQDGFLHADRTHLNLGKFPATPNTIFIHKFKALTGYAVIEGTRREIVAVNRFVPKGLSLQVKFKPSTIGLSHHKDEALPLYIQHHAIQRLDERLGLKKENVHAHLFFSLFDQPVKYVLNNGNSLIEFNMYEYKVGYLVTTLQDDKLIILTFLFLTNDGTPEGQKLRALTGLAKLDKKYLEIDKLSTFIAYRIHEDKELTALFQNAGCSSLLDANNLKTIAADYTPDRDKSLLRRFLGINQSD